MVSQKLDKTLLYYILRQDVSFQLFYNCTLGITFEIVPIFEDFSITLKIYKNKK